jgi:hypothetical protein
MPGNEPMRCSLLPSASTLHSDPLPLASVRSKMNVEPLAAKPGGPLSESTAPPGGWESCRSPLPPAPIRKIAPVGEPSRRSGERRSRHSPRDGRRRQSSSQPVGCACSSRTPRVRSRGLGARRRALPRSPACWRACVTCPPGRSAWCARPVWRPRACGQDASRPHQRSSLHTPPLMGVSALSQSIWKARPPRAHGP